jgi:predicted DNA-binding transcriptional regulator AlpA
MPAGKEQPMPRASRRQPVDPSKLITTTQAMERYGLSRRTFDRLVKSGKVRVYKREPSRVRYYDPDDFDALWTLVER